MLRDIGLIILFAVIIAALGLIPRIDLPMLGGVPITAQSLGITLAGVMIGARRGAFAAAVFLAAVAFGLPLLAGGRGGLDVFTGASAGFLIGFVPAAYVTGLLFERLRGLGAFMAALIAAFIGGYVVLNLIGIPVMAWITDKTVREAATVAMGLLPGGALKALATAVIAYLAAAGMEPLGR